MLHPLGVSKTRGRGLSFFSKNAVLGLGLGLVLVSTLTLTLTLKQYSLKKKIDPDPGPGPGPALDLDGLTEKLGTVNSLIIFKKVT